MLDVTDIPGVRQGDEVVLIGRQGDEEITVEQVAERLGTISYEVVLRFWREFHGSLRDRSRFA